VTENAGEGTDLVNASITYTLPANVENLTLLDSGGAINGTGNASNNSITGNSSNNVLSGLDGNDTLVGGGGDDTLDGVAGSDAVRGGDGNDTYVVDNAGDQVTENAGEGTDTVRTTLASYTLGSNVENLVGIASTSQVLTGNALDNAITGGAANDTLNGAAGNDTLDGGPAAGPRSGGP